MKLCWNKKNQGYIVYFLLLLMWPMEEYLGFKLQIEMISVAAVFNYFNLPCCSLQIIGERWEVSIIDTWSVSVLNIRHWPQVAWDLLQQCSALLSDCSTPIIKCKNNIVNITAGWAGPPCTSSPAPDSSKNRSAWSAPPSVMRSCSHKHLIKNE